MNKFISLSGSNNRYLINREEIQVINFCDKDLKLVIMFKAGSASKLELIYYVTHEYNQIKEYLFSIF